MPHTWISHHLGDQLRRRHPGVRRHRPGHRNLDPAAAEAAITDRPRRSCRSTSTATRPSLHRVREDRRASTARADRGRRPVPPGDPGRPPAGSFGQSACFSFYPGKNLGAPARAVRVVTDDDAVADRVRRLRDHAQDGRHNHIEVGFNYRMEGAAGRRPRREAAPPRRLDRGPASQPLPAIASCSTARRGHAADGRRGRRARLALLRHPGRRARRASARGSRRPASATGCPLPDAGAPPAGVRSTSATAAGPFPDAEEYAAPACRCRCSPSSTADQQAYVVDELATASGA